LSVDKGDKHWGLETYLIRVKLQLLHIWYSTGSGRHVGFKIQCLRRCIFSRQSNRTTLPLFVPSLSHADLYTFFVDNFCFGISLFICVWDPNKQINKRNGIYQLRLSPE